MTEESQYCDSPKIIFNEKRTLSTIRLDVQVCWRPITKFLFVQTNKHIWPHQYNSFHSFIFPSTLLLDIPLSLTPLHQSLPHSLITSIARPFCSCCLPTPMIIASGGGGDIPACGPPASFSVDLSSSAATQAESVHKSRGEM